MSYNFLEHATDAFIEVRAKDLTEAFVTVANAVINIMVDQDKVEVKEQKEIIAKGKDLRYLLFSWLEEVTFTLITEGFAISKVELNIKQNGEYQITAKAYGEVLDLDKHNYKVEIKAPTFHEMKIEQNGGVFMRFLLDL
ncbi:MAG: archease [Nitrosopumilaceae archaeon]|nr:archease [Nitrosopumilaceae archaeon]